MRTERLLVAAAAAVLCGCQATRSERPAMHAFVDASYAEPRTAPTPPVAPPPAALDPVTAELLAASGSVRYAVHPPTFILGGACARARYVGRWGPDPNPQENG